jgi:hypothetical protein
MNSPFFPTTLSIPAYDIGKYVGLRAYQHPFIQANDNVSDSDDQIYVRGCKVTSIIGK